MVVKEPDEFPTGIPGRPKNRCCVHAPPSSKPRLYAYAGTYAHSSSPSCVPFRPGFTNPVRGSPTSAVPLSTSIHEVWERLRCKSRRCKGSRRSATAPFRRRLPEGLSHFQGGRKECATRGSLIEVKRAQDAVRGWASLPTPELTSDRKLATEPWSSFLCSRHCQYLPQSG